MPLTTAEEAQHLGGGVNHFVIDVVMDYKVEFELRTDLLRVALKTALAASGNVGMLCELEQASFLVACYVSENLYMLEQGKSSNIEAIANHPE